ncbi:MAG: CPBP family intramembrane glutamic endopeptidase [Saprospiraceae bacterium]
MYLEAGKRGLNDAWRYILGIIIVFGGYFIGQIPLIIVPLIKMQKDKNLGTEALKEFEKTMDFTIFGIDKNVGFILLILMFVFALIALYIVVTKMHNKVFKDLIAPNRNVNYHKVAFGFILWLILSVGAELVFYFLHPETYTFSFNFSSFIPLFLISFFILPIQTSFEEFFFRGYIMQGLSNSTTWRWLPIVLSSLAFGLMHSLNPEVAKFGFLTMQIYYVMAGIFLAVVTVLDEGLELALGIHAATNITGALLFTYDGSVLQTDTLFKTSEINPGLMTLSLMIAIVVFYSIASKKYQWKKINYLFGKMNTSDENQV